MWSVSEAKTFKRCPRQWFFKHRLASAKATKNTVKRDAYFLSILQSVSAWRGQVVDKVLETVVVKGLMSRHVEQLEAVLRTAREIFDRQLAFAIAKRYSEPGMNKTKAGDSFAALLVVEETGTISENEVKEAWDDVERALRTLYANDRLWTKLRAARRLLAQRTLWFKLCDHQLRAIPDLIALFNGEAPLIIDWKVHFAGTRDSAFQLKTYALALARAEGVDNDRKWSEKDVRLAEVQLLTGQVRHYRVEAEEVAEIENEILESIAEIELCSEGKDRDELDPKMFPVARYAETCVACGFKKLCWSE